MTTYQTFDGHGVDVAVHRADSLDKKALAYIAEHPGCRVLDLGSGVGGQSKRMVEAGAAVTAIDQFDFAPQFAEFGYGAQQLQFIQGDITTTASLVGQQRFDVVLCQRTIHYLPYSAARTLLTNCPTSDVGQLYISVTGTGSLVGEVYDATDVPLTDRLAPLSELGQEMFSISEPVCLYSEVEFLDLLTEAGWQVQSHRVTAFGNIQAICKRTTS